MRKVIIEEGQTHSKPSIIRKRWNNAEYLTEIPYNWSLWKRPVSQTLSKALDISSVTASNVSELLRAPVILSDTTV